MGSTWKYYALVVATSCGFGDDDLSPWWGYMRLSTREHLLQLYNTLLRLMKLTIITMNMLFSLTYPSISFYL